MERSFGRSRPRAMVGALVSLLLVIGGCSDSEGTDETGEVVTSFPEEDLTIVIWHDAEETMNNYYKEVIIPAYEEEHPNVTVDYQIYATQDIGAKILTAVSSNTAPAVMDVPGALLLTLFEKDVLTPAADAYFPDGGVQGLLDGYLPGSLEAQQYEDQLYALPYQENSLSLYMNNRMFEEAGLDPVADAPKTWEEVGQLNEILTKRDAEGRIVQKGFDFRVSVGDHWIQFMFEKLVYQAGGEILDSEGNAVFNSPEAVVAMENWLTATVDPTVTHNESSNPYLDFFTEQDAMSYGGPNAGALGELTNPDMVGNWTAAPIPQIDPENPITIQYNFNFVVSDDVSPAETFVAWDFINFALSTPEDFFEATRLLQPKTELTESPTALEIPGMDVFLHDLSLARPLSQSTSAAELQAAMARAVQRIVLDGEDIQTSLDQGVEEYQQAAASGG